MENLGLPRRCARMAWRPGRQRRARLSISRRTAGNLCRAIFQYRSAADGSCENATPVRLSYLAPDITQAILDGRQPRDLTPEKLLEHSRLPLAWHDQRIVLGFG